MKYISTRGQANQLNFQDVLLSGLARDGGLYVPQQWPEISFNELESFVGLSYHEIAIRVMKPFVGNTFPEDKFRSMVYDAYSEFEDVNVCPISAIAEDHYLLELFHGPTMAFKDIAMQLIGQMFDYTQAKQNSRVTIIAATSGDTGSAAMSAFSRCDYADVFIFFPKGRISEVQRRQMTTIGRPNIHPIAITGDFDDCQALVKQMFNDFKFRDQVRLTGVNSINWARVLCQIVYYFVSAVALGAPKQKISFSVPTGNFGDIFAGYVAKKMGLPIDKLVLATNENDILHRALQTGAYEKRGVMQTMSPSMDIQVASNFERILFDTCERQPEQVVELMDKLARDGHFALNSKILNRMRSDFSSCSVTESQTAATIKDISQSLHKLVCPHTAVGIFAAEKMKSINSKMITLATAHPAKFPEAVKSCTGVTPELPKKYYDIYTKEENLTCASTDLTEIKQIICERIL